MASFAERLADTSRADAPAPGLHVRCESAFDYAGAEYGALLRASVATAFQHPLWLDALMRHLAPARGARPAAITGRDAEGRLLFVLPLVARSMSGVALLESADLGVSDYSAPVIRSGWSVPADLPGLVERALPAHDVLRLKPVRGDGDGWRAVIAGEPKPLGFSAHAVRPALPYDQWRASAFAPSFAKRLDRKIRSFEKAGKAGYAVLSDPEEIRASIRAIRALRAGRFDGDPIQTDAGAAFYEEVAIRGAAQGFARTCRLDLDGEPVGHVFGLAWRGRYHYLLIGCDYERFGRHSPGLILYDRMMRDWAEQGGEVFDFTIGDEPFKADFATAATPMLGVMRAATTRGRLALLAHEARERLRRRTG